MTRQDLIHKWLVYSLVLIPVWFLESSVLSRLPVFGVIPMLLPMAAAVVAALEGSVAGAAFGLGVGVLCDAIYYGTAGSMTLLLTLIGAAVGIAAQYGLRQNFFGCMVCCAGSLVILDGARIFQHLLAGTAPLAPMLRLAAAEVGWSLVFSPLVYVIFRAAYRRVGGNTLM